MAAIKHFIVLMMENRSFDHMFGFLRGVDYDIDGLRGHESNPTSGGEPITVTDNAQYSGDITADPRHRFEDVLEQMYGNSHPSPGDPPNMLGFVKNFEHYSVPEAANIMKCFAPARLPVLTQLAKNFAICDRWFSSVPGPTLPNRLYAHAGTSRGRLDMLPAYFAGFRTIYEVLWDHEVTSCVFYHDWSSTLTFEFLLKHQSDLYGSFDRFLEMCDHNTLPAYSFIEPRYNPANVNGVYVAANDQHPDHDVAEGEILIKTVYEAIRSNENIWTSSVLLIVYDEHGGLYDHALPPETVSPDGMNCVGPVFAFDRLGPRVPAVIVSPYIAPGTIAPREAAYDHTSIIATAMALFAEDAWPSDVLGKRAMNAPTLTPLLNLSDAPRNDYVRLNSAEPGDRAVSDSLSNLQQEAISHASELEQRLPPGQRSKIRPSDITNELEAGRYLSDVADQLLKAKKEGVLSE